MRLQPLTVAPSAGLLKPETRLHLVGLNPGRDVQRILVGVLTRIHPCVVSLQHLPCRGRVHRCIPRAQSPRGTEYNAGFMVQSMYRPSSPSVVNGS